MRVAFFYLCVVDWGMVSCVNLCCLSIHEFHWFVLNCVDLCVSLWVVLICVAFRWFVRCSLWSVVLRWSVGCTTIYELHIYVLCCAILTGRDRLFKFHWFFLRSVDCYFLHWFMVCIGLCCVSLSCVLRLCALCLDVFDVHASLFSSVLLLRYYGHY